MTYSHYLEDNNDILLVAEFCQIAGPMIIKKFPESPQLKGYNMEQSEEALNSLALKAMSMKFNFEEQKDEDSDKLLPYNDDSYILTKFEDLPKYTCLWYFTYLPDLSARGFARRIGIAYISLQDEKFQRHMDCISFGFYQALLCLKYPLCASYRFEAAKYAELLKENIDILEQKKLNLAVEDEVYYKLQKVVAKYSSESLDDLIAKLTNLRFDLLNTHAGLVMDYVPLFFQLYVTEEIHDKITEEEFGYISLDHCGNAAKRVQPIIDIVPSNYELFVVVPPHELRIYRRYELRNLADIATPAFYDYFILILGHIYSYFNQTIADLEFAEIATQHYIYAKINNKPVQGIWFGKNFFIPCQVDELFALSYTLQSYKKYRELYIQVHYNKMHTWLSSCQNYRVIDTGVGAKEDKQRYQDYNASPVEGYYVTAQYVVQIRCPYAPIRKQFAASFYSMFPYLPQLMQRTASLTSSFPAYGHFLKAAREIVPQGFFKTLASALLAGFVTVVYTDSSAFAELLGQALEPFLVAAVQQGERCIIDEFDEQRKEEAQALLTIYTVQQQDIETCQRLVKLQAKYYTLLQFFTKKAAEMYGGNEFLQLIQDIYPAKDEPSVFCISRRLEYTLRKLTISCIFDERPKKGTFEALVWDNINRISKNVQLKDTKIGITKKKWQREVLPYSTFEEFGEKIGMFVMKE